MGSSWRVRIGRKVHGPYTDEQLHNEIVRGVVGVYDEARRDAEPRYREILRYPELFQAFREGMERREAEWPGSSELARKTLDEAIAAHEQVEAERLADETRRDREAKEWAVRVTAENQARAEQREREAALAASIANQAAPLTIQAPTLPSLEPLPSWQPLTRMMAEPTAAPAPETQIGLPPNERPIGPYGHLSAREARSLESREDTIEKRYDKAVDRAIDRFKSEAEYQQELAALNWRRWHDLHNLATEFGVNPEQTAARANEAPVAHQPLLRPELAAIEERRQHALQGMRAQFVGSDEQIAIRAQEARKKLGAEEDKRRQGNIITLIAGGGLTSVIVALLWGLSNSCDRASAEYQAKEQAARNAREVASRAAEQQAQEARASRERARAAEQRAKADRREATFKLPVADRARMAMEQLSKKGDDAHCGLCLSDYYLNTLSQDEAKQPAAMQVLAIQKMRKLTELAKLQAEANANRGIVCADGSGSSCTCGGNHRGCCSHHGGIKGCEPIEKVEDIDCNHCPVEPLRRAGVSSVTQKTLLPGRCANMSCSGGSRRDPRPSTRRRCEQPIDGWERGGHPGLAHGASCRAGEGQPQQRSPILPRLETSCGID